MSETSLKPVIDKLENLFSKFNEKFYGGVPLGKLGAIKSRKRFLI